MNWLSDIEKTRRRQRRKLRDEEKEGDRLRREYLREADRVEPMVMRLLHEVGEAYWGLSEPREGKTHFQAWLNRRLHWQTPRYRIIQSKPFPVSWSVAESHYVGTFEYWRLILGQKPKTGDFYFVVKCKNDSLETNSTNESQLKAVLRSAVERGPEGDGHDL